MNPGEYHNSQNLYSGGGGPESIAMNQFPVGIPPSREHQQQLAIATSTAGGATVECGGGSSNNKDSPSLGGTLTRNRTPSSPQMGMGMGIGSPGSLQRTHAHHRQHHPSCHNLQLPPPPPPVSGSVSSPSPSTYGMVGMVVGPGSMPGSACGTLKKQQNQNHSNHGQFQQMPMDMGMGMSMMSMAIPDFIQNVYPNPNNMMMGNGDGGEMNEYLPEIDDGIPESAIRLYMNQVAGM